jgi:hypothetical protein
LQGFQVELDVYVTLEPEEVEERCSNRSAGNAVCTALRPRTFGREQPYVLPPSVAKVL